MEWVFGQKMVVHGGKVAQLAVHRDKMAMHCSLWEQKVVSPIIKKRMKNNILKQVANRIDNLLCAEGLSSLIMRAERDKKITGIPIAAGGLRLSHLCFADDSLLFYRANIMEWGRIQQLLIVYERASGQKINREKTSIFYSRNTQREFRNFLSSFEGVVSTTRFEKYLGLPALIGRSKCRAFAGIQGRVQAKLKGWKEKFLSQAGKEILIKAVAQAIPTYSMSVFQLPKKLCNDLNSMMSKFWWGQQTNESKMTWMSWKRMGKAKEIGGMGFRELESFNLAMLAKQGWRLVHHQESLVARTFRDKYYRNGNFLEASLGSRPSYAWRSIFNARKLLKEGLVWRVGNGEKDQNLE
jgi:hypothetical protein